MVGCHRARPLGFGIYGQILRRTATFSVGGLERMLAGTVRDGRLLGEDGRGVVFVTNHNNIVMDQTTIAYLLYRRGVEPPLPVIGENLYNCVTRPVFNTLGSIPLKRGKYMRASYELLGKVLDEGISVSIASTPGRSKDWSENTSRRICRALFRISGARCVAAVSQSYELDPTDVPLAKELVARAECESEGEVYEKRWWEDPHSILLGLLGRKGRYHVEFSTVERFDDPDAMLAFLDTAIPAGREMMPTYTAASEALRTQDLSLLDTVPGFRRRIERIPQRLRGLVLAKYARPYERRMLRPGFEPGSPDRKSGMIDRTTLTEPVCSC